MDIDTDGESDSIALAIPPASVSAQAAAHRRFHRRDQPVPLPSVVP
jgi:hypothetical protein